MCSQEIKRFISHKISYCIDNTPSECEQIDDVPLNWTLSTALIKEKYSEWLIILHASLNFQVEQHTFHEGCTKGTQSITFPFTVVWESLRHSLPMLIIK